MKKIINILLAVCLMVSVLSVSALAEGEETVYAGPMANPIPSLIDFNDEMGSDGTNGYRYYNNQREPKHFYYFEGYVAGFQVGENEVEMENRATAATDATSAIKFEDFEYDPSVEKQPEKLVVSVDVKYTDINDDGKDSAEFGRSHKHIAFGNKNIDTESVSSIKVNNVPIVWHGHALTSNGSFNTSTGDDEYFFNWSYNVDVDTDVVTNAVYNNNAVLSETALNNHAYVSKVNNGEWMTLTYVMDLTRDSRGRGNVVVYVDDEKTDTLVSRQTEVDKINFMIISANRSRMFRYDNVKVYTIDNNPIAATGSSLESTENVPLTTEEVTVNFSHEITAAADKYLVVKAGDRVLTAGEDYTIEHVVDETGVKTAKALKVKFAEDLKYNKTYTIGGSAEYFGLDGYALGEETTFASFTTEAAPEINLSNLAIKKGFFGDINVTSLRECLGSTVSLTTTVTTGEEAVLGTVFFGVYKNDVLVNLAMVNKTFVSAESDEITVNIMLPTATESDVVEVKAFVCEGLGNLDAYGTVQTVSTAD